MARSFSSGSSQYLSATGLSIGDWPLTIACWTTRSTNPASDQGIMAVGDQDGGNFVALSWRNVTNRPPCMQVRTTSILSQSTTITTATDTWYHACAVFASDTSRTAYANGGNLVNWTSSISISGLDTIAIGARPYNSTIDGYMSGRVAHAALWNAALTATEVNSLYNGGIGLDPRSIRPDALVGYWPLINADDDRDYWGGHHLTASGSPTYAQHPPVLMRSRPKYVVFGSAAPTVGPVTVTGTRTIGQTVTANATPSPGDATLSYQWEKSSTGVGAGTDISGETASTLALTYADFGDILDTAAYVRVGVVATKNAVPSTEEFSPWYEVSAGGAATVGSPFVSSSIR